MLYFELCTLCFVLCTCSCGRRISASTKTHCLGTKQTTKYKAQSTNSYLRDDSLLSTSGFRVRLSKKRFMQSQHRLIDVLFLDGKRKVNARCSLGNERDVDIAYRAEHPGSDTRSATKTFADDTDNRAAFLYSHVPQLLQLRHHCRKRARIVE